MTSLLDQICESVRADLERRKAERSQADLEADCYAVPTPRDFQAVLERSRSLVLIAEAKKASPSAGLLQENYDPAALAKTYEAAGAKALSVLTEPSFFQGSLDHLRQVKAATGLPVLRKDFVLDDYQMYEACAAEADAVLLIARLLDQSQLSDMVMLAHELSVAALVEVHNDAELEAAQRADARIIGINNRDLDTLTVDLELTKRLAPVVDRHRVVVSESGIHSRADAQVAWNAGAKGILVGEALLRAADPAAAIREILHE
ncbi:MAG: indole-3-glycerol phosphate synthase TrpC [Deltaproteobacteria bacterium]|nr:indole-3-glycerol phosphate synthase TrpC [Deltaproteobacteria bacterium]